MIQKYTGLLLTTVLMFISINSFAQPAAVSIDEVANGFTNGVGLANAGDGSNRMFIIIRTGQILIWDGSQVLATPFLDIDNLVNSSSGEQGLLGLAFHPDYISNGYFYVNYTAINGDTHIARYQVSNSNSNVTNLKSAHPIMQISQPTSNHNGGDMHFNTDGFLYISTGDGGNGGSPSQDTNSLLGKILRIDINADNFPGDVNKNYANPVNNPFVGTTGADEIWLMGLRNPWRFSFDRANGDIIIGDVGEGDWEEVNHLSSPNGGENFGWPCYEGDDEYDTNGCGSIDNYVFPVHALPHGSNPNNNCSMIGGYNFRDANYPRLNGWYFFSDWCTGTLWAADTNSGETWETYNVGSMGTFLVTGFGEGENGEIYVMSHWVILQITDPGGFSDVIFENGFE